MNREGIKITIFYILGILLISKLAVMPLYNSVKGKKAALNEYKETYKMRVHTLERYKSGKKDTQPNTQGTIVKAVYPKDVNYPSIQSEILNKIISTAEKKGMTVLMFELPDIVQSKKVSEVQVLIRLKGTLRMFNDLIKEMDGWDKAIKFKQFDTSRSGQDFIFTTLLSVFRAEK
ncbi:MAG: hypothetical protein HY754_13040 [Nitrospirae bacterium]|nr:hypothetical protein [Nitrospirota bacterium]